MSAINDIYDRIDKDMKAHELKQQQEDEKKAIAEKRAAEAAKKDSPGIL